MQILRMVFHFFNDQKNQRTNNTLTVENYEFQVFLSIKFYWNTAILNRLHTYYLWLLSCYNLRVQQLCQRLCDQQILKILTVRPCTEKTSQLLLCTQYREQYLAGNSLSVQVWCITETSGIYLKSWTFKSNGFLPAMGKPEVSVGLIVQENPWLLKSQVHLSCQAVNRDQCHQGGEVNRVWNQEKSKWQTPMSARGHECYWQSLMLYPHRFCAEATQVPSAALSRQSASPYCRNICQKVHWSLWVFSLSTSQ